MRERDTSDAARRSLGYHILGGGAGERAYLLTILKGDLKFLIGWFVRDFFVCFVLIKNVIVYLIWGPSNYRVKDDPINCYGEFFVCFVQDHM